MHCTAQPPPPTHYILRVARAFQTFERHSKIDLQRSNFYSRHQLIKVHRIPAIALAHPA